MRNWRKRKWQVTRDQNTFCSESEEDGQVEQRGEKKPRSTSGKLLICWKVALSFWLWCSSQESVKSVTCWGHYTAAAAVHYLCILLFFNTNRAHRCKSVYVCLKLSETAVIISLLHLCHRNTTLSYVRMRSRATLLVAVALKSHWGCGSCAQQSAPGRPTLPQSWKEEEKEEEEEQAEVMWTRMTANKQKGKQFLRVTLYWHEIKAENTHLMSWLYLARRSDRQGAPVFIWRDKNTTDHEELQYIFYLLYYYDLLEINLFSLKSFCCLLKKRSTLLKG